LPSGFLTNLGVVGEGVHNKINKLYSQ